MKTPATPKNEVERLAALKEYDILDSLPEKAFDDITMLASMICETPIALVSLVDENRQWFKSHHGIDASETPRSISFCGHAIQELELFVVEDAFDDERFKDNPLTTGAPHVRFYAGAPLTTQEGLNLGTLCVIDSQPKQLNDQQRQALRALANRVVSELDLKLSLKKRHQAEVELLRSKQLLAQIIEVMPNVVFAKDIKDEFRFTIWNKAAENLFGLKASDCIGKRDYEFFPKEQADIFHANDIAASASDEVLEIAEERADTPHGTVIMRTKKVVVKNDLGERRYLLGISEDITAAKNREILIRSQQEKLVASAKLSALGEMAGSVAHEINNPLSIINGKASRLRKAAATDRYDQATFIAELGHIELTVERIAKIVRGLRSFSRSSDHDPMVPVQISQILADTLALCQEKIKKDGVQIRLDLGKSVEIECRETQISQILMNLISNAHFAVKDLSEKWIEIKIDYFEQSIEIIVTDSGRGIPDLVAKKMMEPFFTTKPVGSGTGLGLSISRGLAAEHGGSLNYDAKGDHTSFILQLPKKSKMRGN